MMSVEEYQTRAFATFKIKENQGVSAALNYAVVGLCSEAGEVADWLKKVQYHGKEANVQTLIDECGDVLWYLNLILNSCGSCFQDAMHRNIAKLELRHFKNHGVKNAEQEAAAQKATGGPQFDGIRVENGGKV